MSRRLINGRPHPNGCECVFSSGVQGVPEQWRRVQDAALYPAAGYFLSASIEIIAEQRATQLLRAQIALQIAGKRKFRRNASSFVNLM